MRIAIVSSNLFKIPPDKGHAVQWITSVLADGLVKKGHDVTLFAPGNSQTSGKLFSILDRALDETVQVDWRKKGEHQAFDTALAVEAFTHQPPFDIIHVSLGTWENTVFLNHFTKTNVIVTLHDPLTSPHFQILAPLLLKVPKLWFVSISDAQRKPQPNLPFIGTVYNGIDVREYEPRFEKGEYYCWLGRLSPEKGLDEAIEFSKRTGYHLKIAPLIWPWKKDYWDKQYAHLIDGEKIQLVGAMTNEERNIFLKNAKALLFPISWEEPFGLVMVEALAVGTPVIAYNRGSVSEIVVDGKIGFVIESDSSPNSIQNNPVIKEKGIDGIIAAGERIENQTDEENSAFRHACRQYAEEKFTIERMIDGYERIYRQVLAKSLK